MIVVTHILSRDAESIFLLRDSYFSLPEVFIIY